VRAVHRARVLIEHVFAKRLSAPRLQQGFTVIAGFIAFSPVIRLVMEHV